MFSPFRVRASQNMVCASQRIIFRPRCPWRLVEIILKIAHHKSMRTTLSLDDDALRLIKCYAESRSLSLGKAVSELVRRGLAAQRPTRTVNGLQVFDLPEDSPPVSRKKIRQIELEDE